jgi:hypothetical protein
MEAAWSSVLDENMVCDVKDRSGRYESSRTGNLTMQDRVARFS